jgi:hypothetical protein
MIKVYIDNMVWDLLFEFREQLDLAVELSPAEFELLITREVELEMQAIPAHKADLKAFMETTIARCGVHTHAFFGFFDPNFPPHEQRVVGFDEGRWQTEQEKDFFDTHKHHLKPTKRPTGLFGNEADLSQGMRAHDSVIVTRDISAGPLKEAANQGAKIVFLPEDFDPRKTSLRALIMAAVAHSPATRPF